MYTIYQIKNELDGKSYIGFTTENPPERRFVRHKRLSKRNAPGHLYNAMRKYGVRNFSFLILEIGENDKYGRNIAESMYIAWLGPRYNKTDGGEGAHGCSPSLETRMKISKTHMGMRPSPEQLRALRESMKSRRSMKGYKHTPQARENMRAGAVKRYKKIAPIAQ